MIERIEKLLVPFAALFMSVSLVALPIPAAQNQPTPGGTLLPFELPVPEDAAARSYLGLSGADRRFTIPQIKAQVVIIELFSMYCPVCQKEAFRMNELYQAIQGRKDLKDKIKVIGIGTGDTPFEVDFFRKKYEVPFPLFPDQDLSIYKVLGELRTPYIIGVKISEDGSHEVFYSKLGGLKNTRRFLEAVLRLSGL